MIWYLTNNTVGSVDTYGVTVAKNTISAIDEARFTLEIYTMLLIVSGVFKIRLNGIEYQVSRGDFLFIPLGSLAHIFDLSSSVTIYSYSFTNDYYYSNLGNTQQTLDFKHYIREQVVLLRLSAAKYNSLEALYSILCIKQVESAMLPNDEVRRLYFNIMICELSQLYREGATHEPFYTIRNQSTLDKFIRLVKENFRQHHGVQFYAASLCVSPGHLSKIIKNSSGRTVKQIIKEALITEAEKLLNLQELSILQISEELQFSTTSGFCKFFKKHTSMTPTAFRNSFSSPLNYHWQ